MDGDVWQSFVPYRQTLRVRQDGERWRLQLEMGLSPAPALLSAPPGAELA